MATTDITALCLCATLSTSRKVMMDRRELNTDSNPVTCSYHTWRRKPPYHR